MEMDDKSHPNIISTPDLYTPDPNGVGYVYYQSMLKHRNRIAQIDGLTSKEQTFDTLLTRCIRTAITMQSKGIKSGDFISVCSLNHFDSCVPYIASQFIGATMAAVEPSMSVTEITFLLRQVLPKIIFVEEKAVDLIEEVVSNLKTDTLIVVFGETTIHTPFAQFLTVCLNEDKFNPRQTDNLDETALVIFSSGTTGTPKGICHTHTSILSNRMFTDTSHYKIIASFSTLYWSVFAIFVHISIINGFGRLVYPRFDFNDPWKIFNHKIGFMFLNTLQAFTFLQHEKPKYVNEGNLSTLTFGGSSMSKENILKLKSLLSKTFVRYSYGQTEVFTSILSFPFTSEGESLFQKYPDSVGCPLDGLAYKIVNIDNEEILGPNQRGELRLKSKSQTSGYYNHNYSDTFDSDGWLKTGDIGYYNEENCFFITHRIKESFKYLALHIIPSDIEEILLQHPDVKSAAVIGIPHQTDTNHIMGVVVVHDQNNGVTEDDIVKYVEERVDDKNRLRAGVRFIKNMPLTVSDKINRFKLTQMIINNEI